MMEQGRTPAAQRPPGAAVQQPSASDQPAAEESSVMQTSPDQGADEARLSGDFSTQINTALSLRLPPLALSFPSDSTTELAPIQPPRELSAGPSVQTLPPLSSLTAAQIHVPLPKQPEPSHPAPYTRPTNHWPSLNPFTTYYKPSYLEPAESPPSIVSDSGASRSVSLDDPDVRIAAEALGQMRTECAPSPRNRSHTPGDRKASRDYKTASPSPHNNGGNNAEPQPLLSLITTSYPLLGTTIEGAASAYNSGKNYSPHIKSSTEYVENLVKPMVETVGRKTGVEGRMRWFFSKPARKQRSPADNETDERGDSKRRRSDRNGRGLEGFRAPPQDSGADGEDRRMSISTVDTLPAYDDQRSPAYTEAADARTASTPGSGPSGQQWGQRFVVTTSGLGVAMKQESLKSLKYCLKVITDTKGYVGDVLVKLKHVIEEYDLVSQTDGDDHGMPDGDRPTPRTAEDRSRLIQRMNELRAELFRVIHSTVHTVSKYTGGALPENARNLVHGQLMSLPGRYHFHYLRESEGRRENAGPDAWTRDSAHLALLFAREALQMMTQVGDVLNRTLVSAEEWCETLYRKKNGQSQSPLGPTRALPATPATTVDRDVDMSA